MTTPSFKKLDQLVSNLNNKLNNSDLRPVNGRVKRIRGLLVHASIDGISIGELCYLQDPVSGVRTAAEVIGFEGEDAILSPIGDVRGLSMHTEVVATGHEQRVSVSDALLGRAIDALGNFIDTPSSNGSRIEHAIARSVYAQPPAPLARQIISAPLGLGIRAIDGLITVARGQRIGIFGPAGAGKSSLISSITRGNQADVVVLGLVGERGREVREFLERELDPETRERTVCVVATSDRPAIERTRAALVATTIAEYFRDQGKDVLLVVDSLTRFARAQREIGLSAGEPPTRRGYPPSFFAELPRLLERAGPAENGTITAIYSVLTEGDDATDPVAEEARSILDGHIILSDELARRDHFPAIDVLSSRSRLMSTVASKGHQAAAAVVRNWMAKYQELELLIQVGEYRQGNDPEGDQAIAKHDAIMAFLRQPADHSDDFDSVLKELGVLINE